MSSNPGIQLRRESEIGRGRDGGVCRALDQQGQVYAIKEVNRGIPRNNSQDYLLERGYLEHEKSLTLKFNHVSQRSYSFLFAQLYICSLHPLFKALIPHRTSPARISYLAHSGMG